ncbi:SpoIIE family protein phosphatase [Streptomyces sp. LP11]|uniref:SpoIIE family protein phosphatase n=1 Tax=Streptomyces pyxinicus TaxID=2970331 RepID=A0ABT2B7H6_9ACTN|nr:SpoIIE family protein phosphatase [Streptomyces sp. LP11]MCS0604355.1 SpoIIE family protein phosphatase [Streptomyces sp. LP11]
MAPPSPDPGRDAVPDGGARFAVSSFGLAEMAACGARLRTAVAGAPSVDAAARAVADFFQDNLGDGRGASAWHQVHVLLAHAPDAAREGLRLTEVHPEAAGPRAAERNGDRAADQRLLERLRAWAAATGDDPAAPDCEVLVLPPDGGREDADEPAPTDSGTGTLVLGGPLLPGAAFAVALVTRHQPPADLAEFFGPLAHGVRLALLSADGASPAAETRAARALVACTDAVVARHAAHLRATVAELRSAGAELRRSREELRQRGKELREEAAVVELLQEVGSTLAAELDLDTLVQHAVDAATRLSGAAFGAFFYNVLGETGESYLLYVLSGVDRSAFERFPMPRNTQVFEPTFRGLGVVRSDDITADSRYGHNAPHRGMPRGHLPVRSYLAVPVVFRGTVLGGFFFGHSDPARFTERHERLVTGVASQTAVALQNAQTYRHEREAAMELQRHLLPRLPGVDGIASTSRYLPAAHNRGAGGDWVDLIPLPDGEVALVVGDVMGKGVKAAAVMGQLRTACRAYARLGLAPSEVLEQLSVLVDDIAPGHITTCVYAVLNRERSRLRMAMAGHLPPALRAPEGGVRFLDDEIGPPLGVGRRRYPEQEAELLPGARLLLYTDGLVERRGRHIDEGLRLLRELLAGPVGEIEADCDSWIDALAAGRQDDDIALLYLYRPEDPSRRAVAVARDYPPVSGAVPAARDLVSRTLREWGLSHLADDLTLITDEMVANAVRHARTPLRVEVRRSGDRVVLEVTDSSTEEPRLFVSPPGEFGHRGIFLVDAIATRWGTRAIDGGKVVWAEVKTS